MRRLWCCVRQSSWIPGAARPRAPRRGAAARACTMGRLSCCVGAEEQPSQHEWALVEKDFATAVAVLRASWMRRTANAAEAGLGDEARSPSCTRRSRLDPNHGNLLQPGCRPAGRRAARGSGGRLPARSSRLDPKHVAAHRNLGAVHERFDGRSPSISRRTPRSARPVADRDRPVAVFVPSQGDPERDGARWRGSPVSSTGGRAA